jgi:hypothetical protein
MPDNSYTTDTHGDVELPTPGKWSLNWATDTVASWYYGPKKTSDATFAHLFDTGKTCYVETDDRRVYVEYTAFTDRDDAIADALQDLAPNND